MRTIKLLAVGADPEVFWKTKVGVPQSVEGLIPGSKHDPFPVEKLGRGYFIQVDNVAAEYNIPPCVDAKSFSMAIGKGLKHISTIARKQKFVLAIEPALHFPIEQVTTPHALVLGCEPDFNAWLKARNPRPIPPMTLRTAAGHLHFSWYSPLDGKPPTEDEKENIIRLADVYLGVPSILVTEKSERRNLYGKAGCFRPKEYGAEYRTLDNFWIAHKQYREHAFNESKRLFSLLNAQKDLLIDHVEEWGDEIQQCINNHDPDMALHLMNIFNANPWPIICKKDRCHVA